MAKVELRVRQQWREDIAVPSIRPIPYVEGIREDEERALETVKVSLFPNETSPVAIDFHGTCPRCGDELQPDRQWLVAVAGVRELNDEQIEALASDLDALGIDTSHGDEPFELICSCNVKHPHGPPEKQGCGARFRVRVVWP
jgi:hypothetical protein